MDADARSKPRASHTFLPPPPALYRARSARVADLAAGTGGAAFSGPPDTPPRRSKVAVPFRWEEAPGKPKAAPPPPTPTTCAAATLDAGPVPEGDPPRQDSSHHAPAADQMPPLPLKLPPRLQRAASFAAGASPAPAAASNAAGTVPDGDPRQDSSSDHAAAEHERPPRLLKLPPRLQRVASFAATPSEYTPSPSPKTVLHENPYFGRAGGGSGGGGGKCGKPPKWVRSGGAALRRTPSAGMAFLSRTWSKRQGSSRNGAGGGDHERDAAAGPGSDAPWWSPSSSSSLSSVSGGRGRPADGREASSSEDDGSPRGSASVRITRTRLTRNRSLPSMTTSNLWASVRRSVKHITPILHGARSWATTRYGHW